MSEPSVGRSSGMMAIANLASRITGFVRQLLLVAVLGVSVLSDSYNVSNTLPNIVYELLLGGVLTSVLIPLLVRAQAEDADSGELYTRRLITLAGAALLAATLVATAAAPLLTWLYVSDQPTADPELAAALAYMLLPQIFFYGIGALLGALLNTRGSFGAFAWAPVLNNVVVIAVLGLYLLVPEPARLLVLGVGTTFGIAAQALVLLPAVRRSGFRFRPAWGWDPRVTQAGRLALWATAYTLIGVPGYMITSRVATAAQDGSFTVYTNAWLLLQVPYGVLGVSLLTALMPRMSRAAAAGRTADVVADLARGGRLSAVLLVPISVLFTVFGIPVGVCLFGLREANLDGAAQIGAALAVSAFGLLPYAITMLQLRVFYAMTDSRTPVVIQVVTVGLKVPMLLACPALLPPEDVVLGLAAANSVSFVVGAGLGQVLLRRRLGSLSFRSVVSTTWRALLASAAGMGFAFGLVQVVASELVALGPVAAAWTTIGIAVVTGLPLTVAGMRLLSVPELEPLLLRVERLVDRLRSRR